MDNRDKLVLAIEQLNQAIRLLMPVMTQLSESDQHAVAEHMLRSTTLLIEGTE